MSTVSVSRRRMVCLERVKAWFSQICVQPEEGWAKECVIGDWVQEKTLMQHEVVKKVGILNCARGFDGTYIILWGNVVPHGRRG